MSQVYQRVVCYHAGRYVESLVVVSSDNTTLMLVLGFLHDRCSVHHPLACRLCSGDGDSRDLSPPLEVGGRVLRGKKVPKSDYEDGSTDFPSDAESPACLPQVAEGRATSFRGGVLREGLC